MKKPVSRVLIINDEPLVLKEFVKGLNAAARSLDNPLGITFSGVTTAREALEDLAMQVHLPELPFGVGFVAAVDHEVLDDQAVPRADAEAEFRRI